MLTVVLLILSNVFMTFAWYGHLKYMKDSSLWKVVIFSWGIALFEYILMVPANRLGYQFYKLEGFQLKILQEMITISIFIIFAIFILGEKVRWNYMLSFIFIILAGYFAFGNINPTKP